MARSSALSSLSLSLAGWSRRFVLGNASDPSDSQEEVNFRCHFYADDDTGSASGENRVAAPTDLLVAPCCPFGSAPSVRFQQKSVEIIIWAAKSKAVSAHVTAASHSHLEAAPSQSETVGICIIAETERETRIHSNGPGAATRRKERRTNAQSSKSARKEKVPTVRRRVVLVVVGSSIH